MERKHTHLKVTQMMVDFGQRRQVRTKNEENILKHESFRALKKLILASRSRIGLKTTDYEFISLFLIRFRLLHSKNKVRTL